MKKIIEKFRKSKQKMTRDILRMDAVDLAYFYVRGATDTERALINEAIPMAPTAYQKSFKHYRENSHLFDIDPELKKRFSEVSELEKKAG